MGAVGSSKVTLCRRAGFSSGHRYYQPSLSLAENERLYGSWLTSHGHGHNYVLEAYVKGQVDPATGMVINLRELDELLKNVIQPLDHAYLNDDVGYFRQVVPTTENIALFLFQEIEQRLDKSLVLCKIRLYEGDDLWVDVSQD